MKMNWIGCLLMTLVVGLCFQPMYVIADETATVALEAVPIDMTNPPEVGNLPGAPDWLQSAFDFGAEKAPWLVVVLSIIGVLRVVIDPIDTAIHSYIRSTSSTSDDDLYAKVKAHPALKVFLYILKLTTSITIKPK